MILAVIMTVVKIYSIMHWIMLSMEWDAYGTDFEEEFRLAIGQSLI